MNNLREKIELSFCELEGTLWQELRKLFCQTLKEILEKVDEQIFQLRDKKQYKVCEKRSREIETLLGPVKFKRRSYIDQKTNKRIFLLDEIMELPGRVRISPGLTSVLAEIGVTGPSYRQAREEITKIFGDQIISHESIRQVIKQVGESLVEHEKQVLNNLEGKRKVPILFLEVDGMWISLQQENKPSKEIRTLVSHEGWQQKHPSSNQYQLINRHYFCCEDPGEFWEQASRFIEAHYDLEETIVVINGDRASWIRKGIEYFPQAIYQADRFHIKRDLKTLLKNQPEKQDKAIKAFTENNTGSLFCILAEALTAEKEKSQKTKLKAAIKDLLSIEEALKDYRVRLKQKGYNTEHLRGLGAAESQIDRYSNRLKKRGQSWRQYGLKAMLACLNARFEGRLIQAVEALDNINSILPRQELNLSASKVAADLIDNVGWVKKGHLPIRKTGKNASGGLSVLARYLACPVPNI